MLKGNLPAIASLFNCPVSEVERCCKENNLTERIMVGDDEVINKGKYKNKKDRLQQTSFKMSHSTIVKHQNKKIHAPFTPCVHAGPCNQQNTACSCIEQVHFCTKHCMWGYQSPNLFPGCRCKNGMCRTHACPCYASKRECDPDLCHNCGAGTCPRDVSPPVSQSCRNDNITMRRHKHLLVAESGIEGAGWGLFTKEAIKKNDFIQEYVGELITQEEADRRGRTYDKVNRSYLFNLNSEFVVDASRKGNKTKVRSHQQREEGAASGAERRCNSVKKSRADILVRQFVYLFGHQFRLLRSCRFTNTQPSLPPSLPPSLRPSFKFANHNKKPNCYTQVKVVGGDHRIGLYAKEDIEAQSELFFDYRYDKGLESDLLTLKSVTTDWMKDGLMANKISKKSVHGNKRKRAS